MDIKLIESQLKDINTQLCDYMDTLCGTDISATLSLSSNWGGCNTYEINSIDDDGVLEGELDGNLFSIGYYDLSTDELVDLVGQLNK
jgi:hypothetical protein